MERNLTALRKSTTDDIYIFLKDAEIGAQFLRDAEYEGFTIGGDKPTTKPYATVMALHDTTISYVGTNGMIRFGCGCTRRFHRVDYEKFISGEKKYAFRECMGVKRIAG